MPTGVYKRTKKHLENMSKAQKGRKRPPFSEEWKKNLSLAGKGKKRKFTEKHKNNLSIAAKKRFANPENLPYFLGKHFTKEHRKNLSLVRGGTGIPYENTEYGAKFDDILKEQIRFRDNYICQVCGCTQLENGRQLDVHHKNYDKKKNKKENLISLCKICHRKTNFNRKYWKKYFKNNIGKINNE